jgi:hypothetical protein
MWKVFLANSILVDLLKVIWKQLRKTRTWKFLGFVAFVLFLLVGALSVNGSVKEPFFIRDILHGNQTLQVFFFAGFICLFAGMVQVARMPRNLFKLNRSGHPNSFWPGPPIWYFLTYLIWTYGPNWSTTGDVWNMNAFIFSNPWLALAVLGFLTLFLPLLAARIITKGVPKQPSGFSSSNQPGDRS